MVAGPGLWNGHRAAPIMGAVMILESLALAFVFTAQPEGAVAPTAAGGAAARFEFVTFGDRGLARADLVAETRATAVHAAARGVAVVRLEVTELLCGAAGVAEAVVLAAPGEFREGLEYVVFLERFAGGERFTARARIAAGGRDYEAKLRVLRRFARVDRIAGAGERARAIRDVLLEHLADDDLFVKWNALAELGAFVKVHGALIGERERALMVDAYRREPSPTFRGGLERLLGSLGIRLTRNPERQP